LITDSSIDALMSSELGGVLKCQACGAIVSKLSAKFKEQNFIDSLFDIAIDVCKSGYLNVDDPQTVCPDIVPLMGTSVLDMISTDLLTELRTCNMLLGLCSRPTVETLEFSDF